MLRAVFANHWGKLLLISIVLFYFFSNYPRFYPFPEATTHGVASMLTIFGFDATPYKNFVVVNNFPPIEVSAECSGIILLLMFPLVILLMPHVSLPHRLAALLFLPLLFAGNILRISIDALIGIHTSPDTLIFFHNTVGQVFIFAWAIMIYILWLKTFGNFPRDEKAKEITMPH